MTRTARLDVRAGDCTNASAKNFVPWAHVDDGSCEHYILGCLDSAAANFAPEAEREGGTCLYLGCTASMALNYDPSSNVDEQFLGSDSLSAKENSFEAVALGTSCKTSCKMLEVQPRDQVGCSCSLPGRRLGIQTTGGGGSPAFWSTGRLR